MDTTDAQPETAGAGNETGEPDLGDGVQRVAEPRTARVIGLDSGEENLILELDGEQFTLPVTAELRVLVRSATSNFVTPAGTSRENDAAASDTAKSPQSPQSEQSAQPAAEITPREIQTRIRAGETPEDIAAVTGADISSIRRYESPIIAERNYVIEQAQAAPIMRDAQEPNLGEVALDRLAARGVASEDLVWSAHRIPGAAWTITLQFTAGELQRTAAWSYEPRGRLLTALDDEARWLTESEEIRDEPIPARLTPVRDWVYDVDSDGGVIGSGIPDSVDGADGEVGDAGEGSESESTRDSEDSAQKYLTHQQDLLDELSSRRGRRQPILADDADDPFDLLGEIPAAHPPASRPGEAVDAEILQLPEFDPDQVALEADPEVQETAPAKPLPDSGEKDTTAPSEQAKEEDPVAKDESAKPRPARRNSKRPSVPSWDEIVFGARTD